MIPNDATITANANESNGKLDLKPYTVRAITSEADLPALPDELIEGVMRKGDKLMLAGASKAGKTCNLLSLATAIATGAEWCGMQCAKGRVLYVNLEVRDAVFMRRQLKVCEAMSANLETAGENLEICNARGKFTDVGSLVDALASSMNGSGFDVVIIDPAYKVQDGIENNADAITRFCGELDRLAEALGCSVIYSHHHSKGYQAWKDAEDRASGSGVFARDADAIIDMTELEPDSSPVAGRPFRMEFVLRDFPEHDPVEVWFDYPIHRVDQTGSLAKLHARKPGGTMAANSEAKEKALVDFERQLDIFMGERNVVTRKDFERASNISPKKLKQLLERSERFENVSFSNHAEIRRIPATASASQSAQPTGPIPGAQGAGSL